MPGVWIFAENREQTLELLNIGRFLASKMGVRLTVFRHDREYVKDYFAYGADDVLLLSFLPEDQPLEAHVPIIVEEAKREDPDLFLIAATSRGKAIASRIAALINAGLCSGCIALNFNEGKRSFEMERLVYGGAAVERVTCTARPAMATIPPRTFEPAVAAGGREGRVRELPAPPVCPVRVIEKRGKIRETRDITEAKVVVCVGRGFEKKEDLAMARELSGVIGGEIGCTRPISEELHWLPEELCIGLSGVEVKPDFYIGLGVSGQIQHVTGIRNARVIAAVNKEESAPIFGVADFGIVGDLYDVVPKLIAELKKQAKG
ncbi:MAG: electron transfer flavoprotein subunit alpha/FixB family protein [Syntrophales bacterium]